MATAFRKDMCYWILRVLVIVCSLDSSARGCPRICVCGYHNGAHTMDCGSQGLRHIGLDIPEWTTSMDLDGNELEVLSLNFCDVCVYFEELSIRYNRIAKIKTSGNLSIGAKAKPSTFCSETSQIFPRLWSVNLKGNSLRRLPKCLLFVWPVLKHLNLDENRFTSFRSLNILSHLAHTHSLEELYLRGNRISQMLRKDLYSSSIAVRRLKVLSLARNRIHSIESGVFTFFDALEELDLSQNKIGFLPDFSFVTKGEAMVTIRLNGNYLDWVSLRAFAGLPNLQHLDLSNNEITCLMPKYWSTCQYFYSVSNGDIALPVSREVRHFHRRFTLDFRSLRTVDIYSNPWRCDCKLASLVNNVGTSIVFASTRRLNCSAPTEHVGRSPSEVMYNLKGCQ